VTWSPGFIIKFLRNLPYWLSDFSQLKPGQMLGRIRRKARVVKKTIDNVFRPHSIDPSRVDIEAIIDNDLSQIPESHHKFLEAHYRALLGYIPQIYPGRITLFRTRAESLFGPFDPELGWSELAAQGVEIKEIPGFHAAMLQEPYVQILAEQLRICLDEVQANVLDKRT
jgi:thioesterase domain-containing protein